MPKPQKQDSEPPVLPKLPIILQIRERLELIFPPEFPNRTILIGIMASRVIYVFLYGGFIEGSLRYLRPSNVYFFTEEQAARRSNQERVAWLNTANAPKYRPKGERWYADNSREPIRDNLMRNRWLPLGIMQKLPGYAVTSGSPINYLSADFAALFDPELKDDALAEMIAAWRKKHLNKATLTRMALKAQGVAEKKGDVFIEMPDGTRARISAGPSSLITKGLIEDFARIHLRNPSVLWLSASDKKAYPQYVELSSTIGLKFDLSSELPDLILADLADQTRFLFCEVVASEGPVTEERKHALLAIIKNSNIPEDAVSFLTAFEDREAKEFRKTFSEIAVGTQIWFRSEPNLLVIMKVEEDPATN
jgi:hypothetical protein